MSTTIQPGIGVERERMTALFEEKSPVLVEVRFPHMGTSSDWHLCDDLDDLDELDADDERLDGRDDLS